MANATAQGNRWWEFYVVRYTMGSVIGACILYILSEAHKLPTHLDTIVILAILNFENINLTWLILLGVTYCYVTSAPILVLHACRFALKWKWRCFGYVMATIIVSFIIAYSRFGSHPDKMLFICSATLLALLLLQYGACLTCLFAHSSLQDFYTRLAGRRAASKDSEYVGEIVESYRHLKEHGNSFFIVLCELIFAAGLYYLPTLSSNLYPALFPSPQPSYLSTGLFITAWIIPAVSVWLVATLVEHKFNK